MKILREDLRKVAKAQGHFNTGKFSDSLEFEISKEGDFVTGKMYAEDYAGVLEFGVKASRIPFSGSKGKGGVSLYIQGLIGYFESKGLSDREAKSAAFATAHVHAREGMPTRASYAFSSTGERTGFIAETIEKNLESIGKIIQSRFGALLELRFADNLGQYENIKFG